MPQVATWHPTFYIFMYQIEMNSNVFFQIFLFRKQMSNKIESIHYLAYFIDWFCTCLFNTVYATCGKSRQGTRGRALHRTKPDFDTTLNMHQSQSHIANVCAFVFFVICPLLDMTVYPVLFKTSRQVILVMYQLLVALKFQDAWKWTTVFLGVIFGLYLAVDFPFRHLVSWVCLPLGIMDWSG